MNAAGGIDGRRIEFLGVTDDRRDASATTAEVHRLVDDVGVDAVVPVVTSRFADDGTLARARTPAFGWGIAGGFCGNRWAFAITGCLAPLLPRQVPTIWGRLVAAVARQHGFRAPDRGDRDGGRGGAPIARRARARWRGGGAPRHVRTRATLGTGESAAAGVDAIADAVMAAGDRPPSVVFSVAGFAAVGALQDALRARSYPGVMTNLVQYSPVLVVAAPRHVRAHAVRDPGERAPERRDAEDPRRARDRHDGPRHAVDARRMAGRGSVRAGGAQCGSGRLPGPCGSCRGSDALPGARHGRADGLPGGVRRGPRRVASS